MRIAQVAPLYESVPPKRYGGTERVVSWLTEALVAAGHDVTLFASADSQTSARLVPCSTRGLRLSGSEDEISPHMLAVERAIDPRHNFDIVHFHTGTFHFPAARRSPSPTITTMHGRIDIDDLHPALREFRDLPLVAISDEQRAPAPWAHWVGTVHHGLPKDDFVVGDGGGDYLVFLGRIAREKRPDRAIEIARAAGVPLKIAAKVAASDRDYYEKTIRPMIESGGGVEFLGEVDDQNKQALLGGARGLLFPIDWPEPFGLAMIEALACGTPIIAFREGSVPSIVDDEVTGFIVDDIDAAARAVARLCELSRAECRAVFEERFSVTAMTADYVDLYKSVIERAAHSSRRLA
ncbi:MAG TPA: glycosyltransferase family 4 protein [Myxococcota bacterium]|jgi:glycosyltransferase involved in cell wall biosynthesis